MKVLFSILCAIALVMALKTSDIKHLLKIRADSLKIVLQDTAYARQFDTLHISNTFKDTTKLINTDTVWGIHKDTVKIKK